MRLNPNSFGMTLLLAFMSAMGPISTDFYVPALPQLAQDLHTVPARVQLTMSAYLIGFAFGQIFYGPMADKFGRKPVLLFGLSVYLAACVVSGFAPDIDTLIGARFLQGIGGAGPVIVARAIVRDLYSGARAGQQLALMATIMGLAPIVSPTIGGLIAIRFGWRASFVVMFAMVCVITAGALLGLPETIKQRMQGTFSLRNILGSFSIVWRNNIWRSYASLQAMAQTGLFTFVSTSPFVLQPIYGLSPFEFGLGFSVCSIAFVGGAWFSSRMVARKGLDYAIGVGVLLFVAGGVTQLIGYLLFPRSVLVIFMPELVFFAGVGFVIPNAVAGLLTPFPERAGAATSLAGFLQMMFSAAVGILVAALIHESAWPIVICTFAMSAGAGAIFLASRRVRASKTQAFR
ncbi:MAG: multidrug effflux MFS transporter [Beijerinckiaceae bacterium]